MENDRRLRRKEEEEGYGIPYADPETQAISEEFSTTPSRGPRTADFQDSDNSGRDDRDEPSTGVPSLKTPSPAPTGVPNIGQEGATVKESVNPGSGAKNYDVVEGADQLQWGDTSRLSGFNTNEWGEGGTEGYHDNSVKNTFGKLATRYDPSPEGARQIVNDPDFKRMFPQAVLIDHPTDPKIQFFPDDPPVDVLASSGAGGWQWLPEGGGGGGAVGGGGVGGGGATPDIDALGDSDVLAQIQAALAAMGKGEQPMLDDALQKEFTV